VKDGVGGMISGAHAMPFAPGNKAPDRFTKTLGVAMVAHECDVGVAHLAQGDIFARELLGHDLAPCQG
ncbi:hypothetical protein CN633_31950, partial [Bacillus toyonensis]